MLISKRPVIRLFLAGASFFALASCALLNSPIKSVEKGPVCSVSTGQTQMTLRGSTNEQMLTCVLKSITPFIKTVKIDSHGGSVDHAIDIANALSALNFKLIVSGNCSSSCSNYILPLAREVELLPGALLLSHGGIDEGFVDYQVQKRGSELERAMFSRLEETAKKQSEFLARHGIAPGWLIARRAQDYGKISTGLYISGEPEAWEGASKASLRYFLIEEDFVKSCLPKLTVTGFDTARIAQARRDPKQQSRLAKSGIYPTGTMRCSSPKSQAVITAEPDAP